MAKALDWKPDPFQPHSVVQADSAGMTYSVTTWHPCMTSEGAYTALAGDHDLGRFPYTQDGRRAALTACESHAAFMRDSLRAQAERSDPSPQPI